MLKATLTSKAPIADIDDYFEKNNFIDGMQILRNSDCECYDDNIFRFYNITSLNGLKLNKYIKGESEIKSIDYCVSSSVTKDIRKKVKNGITLKELIDLMSSNKIRIVKIDFCDKEDYTGKIKGTYVCHEHKKNTKAKSNTVAILEAYIARLTYNKNNSSLREIITQDRVENDLNNLIDDIKHSPVKRLFISER